MLSACAVPQPCCWVDMVDVNMPTKPAKEWKLCVIGIVGHDLKDGVAEEGTGEGSGILTNVFFDPGVGKTSIGIRFKHDRFVDKQISTVGAAFFSTDVTVDGEVHRLNVWDTAGQERYRALAPLYYRNTEAVIMVYSIDRYESFKHVVDVWLKNIRTHTDNDVILTLVGNKQDTAQDKREVQTSEAEQFARDVDAGFFETSAKTGDNITKLFMNIARRLKVLNKRRERQYSTASASSMSSTDSEVVIEQQKPAGCCR